MLIDFEPIPFIQAQKDFNWEINPLFEGTNLEEQWMEFWYENLDPCRATYGAAAYDIFSPYAFTLKPGEEITIPTGTRVLINNSLNIGFFILPRSGAGFKCYTRLANTIGLIDKDYIQSKNKGHCWVKIRNESTEKEWVVKTGDAIAQGVFLNYYLTDRDAEQQKQERDGGFGSTTV